MIPFKKEQYIFCLLNTYNTYIDLEANAKKLNLIFIRSLFLKYYKYTSKMCIQKQTAFM